MTALDSGAYGSITITSSVTLQAAPGVQAMLGDPSSTTAVTINANKSAVVVLRNLQISKANLESTSQGLGQGIESSMVGSLHVENCVVSGFRLGIYVHDSDLYDLSTPKLFLNDSIVRNNRYALTLLDYDGSINHTRFENNFQGLDIITSAGTPVDDRPRTTLRDCLISGSLFGLSASAKVDVEDCVIIGNGTGIWAVLGVNPESEVNVSNTRISGNSNGLSIGDDQSKIRSFGNNRLYGNKTNGIFSSTLLQF
jgi:hypothetical protein